MKKSVNLLKISFLLLGLGLLFSFGISSSAAANNSAIYVSSNGNDTWNGLNSTWTPNTLNGPKATIKNATGTVKSGGTVYVANGNYFDSNIQIIKNMTIIGQSQQNTIITGLKGSIFLVGKGVSLNLINMTILGGTSYGQGGGGAVHNEGFLTVNGVNFIKNYADNTGGAIYSNGTLNVVNSSFMGNIVGIQGGAISNDGKMTVTDSTFSTNNAGQFGGAIFNNGDSTLINDNFQDNSASTLNSDGSNGGAIYNTATITIIKSTFNNNHATNNGGAIFNEQKAQLTINNTKFTKNYSEDHGYGGAVGNDGSASVTDTSFSQNTAIPGGAIGNMGSLNLTSCTFNNNTALQYGGAVLNVGTLKINNINFSNNTVTKGIGGAIANAGQLTITGSNSFTKNHADNGGAIYNAGKMLVNPNTTFTANSATSGGCIYNGYFQIDMVNLLGNATIIGNTFKNNTAQIGGTILNEGNLNITNCTFSNNTAVEGGAVINAGTITISGSNFVGNQATSDGGAIININKRAQAAKAKAVNNAKTTAGTTDNSTTATSSASSNSNSSYLIVEYCNFTANSAKNGGAICNVGNMTVLSSTFIGNIAVNGTGGAISNHFGPVAVTNTTKPPKDIKTATVTTKTSDKQSGETASPAQDDSLPKSTVSGCTFINNNSTVGNVIYNSYNLDVHFCRIIGNTSSSIIYSDNGTVNATLNWWGSNSNPSKYVVGNVTVDPWIVLNIKANPTTINHGKNSTVTTWLVYDSNGVYHDPLKGHVPDGIPVKFEGTLGTLNPIQSTILSGKTESTYTSKQAGTGIITATVDNQSVSTNITSNPVSDLYVKIISSTNNSTLGKTFTVTYKLGNNGPDTATNVTIYIPLPTGFTISNINGDGSWNYNKTSNMVTWIVGNVPVGDPYLYITGNTSKTGVYEFGVSNSTVKLTIKVQEPSNNSTTSTKTSDESKNTIPMQNTGMPIAGLALGVLSLMGGIISMRKR